MSSYRYTRWEAQTLFEHYADEALGSTAATLDVAIRQSSERLNRAAGRALGARGDGRFHPAGARKDVIRTRNAW